MGLVIPFEKLRVTDVGTGRRQQNSSLGEMISQLADSGVRARRLCHHRHAYREFLAQSGLDAKINAALMR